MKDAHQGLLAALRAGDVEAARTGLEACRALDWGVHAALLESYARRLERGA
jgi:hypothetical protein